VWWYYGYERNPQKNSVGEKKTSNDEENVECGASRPGDCLRGGRAALITCSSEATVEDTRSCKSIKQQVMCVLVIR